jgi:hypothetical protein
MHRKFMAILLLSAALPVSVVAQDSTEPATTQKMQNTNTNSDATTNAATQSTTQQNAQATATNQSGETFVTVPQTGAWRVSDLEGKPVYGAEGDNIGDIKDVLVNKDGTVTAVLVGVGGFLGIGEKDVAVSMTALEFGPGMTQTEANAAAQQSNNPAVSGETTAATDGAMNADQTTAATASDQATAANAGNTDTSAASTDPAVTNNNMAATQNTDARQNTNANQQNMASNNGVAIGNDGLPDRIVLNVTREELEKAPAFPGVQPSK